MRSNFIFFLSFLGVLSGLVAAYVFSRQNRAEAPVFSPAANPYAQGIYATGIVESYLTHGENVNLYPEVAGRVTNILVDEGQVVHEGDLLVQLDDSVPRATAEQQRAQADAALSALEALRAQPRKEILDVSQAQVEASRAGLKSAQDQAQKLLRSYRLNPKSVAKNDLDNALNAAHVAEKNLEVSTRQYELTRAGAWVYDIENQERQYEALLKQYAASNALLAKYSIRAPMDGVVLTIKTAVGSYVSSQGVYGTYTQGLNPILVMGGGEETLQVRTYVDEILIHRIPNASKLSGQMYIRGTQIHIPLEFLRVQPYVTPKIELSNQRQERVDVRVLPMIFRFQKPKDLHLYPGQLVDVYLGEGPPQKTQLGGTAGK